MSAREWNIYLHSPYQRLPYQPLLACYNVVMYDTLPRRMWGYTMELRCMEHRLSSVWNTVHLYGAWLPTFQRNIRPSSAAQYSTKFLILNAHGNGCHVKYAVHCRKAVKSFLWNWLPPTSGQKMIAASSYDTSAPVQQITLNYFPERLNITTTRTSKVDIIPQKSHPCRRINEPIDLWPVFCRYSVQYGFCVEYECEKSLRRFKITTCRSSTSKCQ